MCSSPIRVSAGVRVHSSGVSHTQMEKPRPREEEVTRGHEGGHSRPRDCGAPGPFSAGPGKSQERICPLGLEEMVCAGARGWDAGPAQAAGERRPLPSRSCTPGEQTGPAPPLMAPAPYGPPDQRPAEPRFPLRHEGENPSLAGLL